MKVRFSILTKADNHSHLVCNPIANWLHICSTRIKTKWGGHKMGTPSRLLREDLVGGTAVAVLGLLGFYATTQLDIGTLAEIGPGLFPWALALILMALSLVLIVVTWRGPSAPWYPTFNLRALGGIIGALLIFALFMRGTAIGPITLPALGVTGATPLAILVAGFADKQTRWKQLAIFAVCLTTFCTLLFRFALGLPLPVAPWLIGY
jgi:hypothetical protein